jgi:poly(hydroxyalkanoate) depolymerase family esterase
MNTTQAAAMAEATRLTREGRLTEATALLQRLMNGETARPATPEARGADAPPPSAARPRRIIDVDPETGATLGAAPAGATEAPRVAPKGLRDLLRRVGEGVSAPARGKARPRPPAPPLPEGASFATHRFDGPAGQREYKLYLPATRPAGPVPLLVMLHGCTQSPDDFAAGTRMNALAEEHGLLVAYPAQPPSANAQKCWNWFNPGDQGRDAGEPSLIAGITRQVIRDHAVDPARVYVAGLSAGGAAAAVMGQAYPDLYAAIGVHSGLACGAARDVPSAFAAMRGGANGPLPRAAGTGRVVPTVVFHADRDATVHPRNGEQVASQATAALPGALQTEVERGQVPGGHAFTRSLHRDAAGRILLEQWMVHGGGHAWSGGSPSGSYTDPRGPDASRAMLRFFLDHARGDGGA